MSGTHRALQLLHADPNPKAWASAFAMTSTEEDPVMMTQDIVAQFRSMGSLWFLGVLICVFGTTMTALGLVLQKLSHSQNTKCKEAVIYYRQAWWQFGFAVFLFGQIFNVFAMSLAPQPMLSCIGAWALIFNVIFAWAILGELMIMLELVPMVGMVIGAVIVVCMTPVQNQLEGGVAGIEEIIGPFFEWPFVLLSAVGATFLLLFRLSLAHTDTEFETMFWALSSAFSSGYTVTLFKCISLLLVAWGHTQPWRHWQCYTILFVASALCIFQTHTLNMALHSGRAMIVVPTIFAMSLVAQIVVCEATYHELNGMTRPKGILFVIGLILILSSVVALVHMKIAVDVGVELPDGDEVEAKAPNEATPLTKADGVARTWSWEALTELPKTPDRARTCSTMSIGSVSSMDHEAFPESFGGRRRAYTVSVCGPLGLA